MSCRSAARCAGCSNLLHASPKPGGKTLSRTSEWYSTRKAEGFRDDCTFVLCCVSLTLRSSRGTCTSQTTFESNRRPYRLLGPADTKRLPLRRQEHADAEESSVLSETLLFLVCQREHPSVTSSLLVLSSLLLVVCSCQPSTHAGVVEALLRMDQREVNLSRSLRP